MVETPLKENKSQPKVLLLSVPDFRILFRSTARLRQIDDRGLFQTRCIHSVQCRGQRGRPLIALNWKSGDRRSVEVDFLYPPDATLPQILTIKTLGN